MSTSPLTHRDHGEITQYLTPLNNQDLINVGVKLGLRYPTLQKMSPESLLNDMINAWLRRDDDVAEPTWENLCSALEGCGHNGVASKIKNGDTQNLEDEFLFVPEPTMETLSLPQELCEHKAKIKKGNTLFWESFVDYGVSEIMEEHNSYHEAITGSEAVERLKLCTSHGYLTRYSERRKCFKLSVYQRQPNNVIKHFKISFRKFLAMKTLYYKIEGKNEEFRGLATMLAHYEKNRIDPALRTIGECVTITHYCEKKRGRGHKQRKEHAEEQKPLEEVKAEYTRLLRRKDIELMEVEKAAEQQIQRLSKEVEDMSKKVEDMKNKKCCIIL